MINLTSHQLKILALARDRGGLYRPVNGRGYRARGHDQTITKKTVDRLLMERLIRRSLKNPSFLVPSRTGFAALAKHQPKNSPDG